MVAIQHQSQIARINENIQDSYVYFKNCRDYFNETRKFVLKSNLTDEQLGALRELERPPMQFNVLEASISRLLGEWAKQEPGIEASAEPSDVAPSVAEIKFVEDYMRNLMANINSYEIYRDLLTGGFSCIKIWTEYESEKSFSHKICADRCYDPLLVGFDPMAQKTHKGDGSYLFEFIPLTEEQAKNLYPDIDFSTCYQKDSQGFQWGYKSGKKKIILFCDYYEKKTKKVMIYKLSDNRVRTKKEYEKIMAQCIENGDVVPAIINKRMTEVPYVCRYRLTKDILLEYKETDFCGLPIVFVDGNSVMLRQKSANSDSEQVVKSYVHNAIDTQKLKNLAGQTIANKIETMVQSQWKSPAEGIPVGYEDSYTNPQKAGVVIYNAFKPGSELPLPPPEQIVQLPLPQEIISTFMGADETIQGILGSYNAAAGITDNDLSGKAMIIGTANSSAAAMPYTVNYLSSLQQVSKIVLDLIPKLYITPRSVPIITSQGKRQHVSINNPKDPMSLKIQYNPSDLNIILSPGINFDAQKTQALETIQALAQSLPSFAAMINESGLPIVCDNLDIKGADELKKMADEWTKNMQMNKQNQPPNPALMKLQLDGQEMQMKNQIDQVKLSQQQQLIDIKQQEAGIKQQAQNLEDVMAQVNALNDRLDTIVQLKKNATEREVHGLNIAMQKEENDRNHQMGMIEHAHKVDQHHHQVAMDVIHAQQTQEGPKSDN